jgi:gas vesicle protein
MAANRWQTTTSVFFVGLGVGAALGILFAPKSGKETRDQIFGTVKEGVDAALAQGSKLGRRAQTTFEDAKEHVRDAAEAGERAYREAKTATS